MRQVYLEVKLREAFALARAGRKAEAAALAAAFGQPVAGFDFTKDGMTAFVKPPRFQYLLRRAAGPAGNDAAAREHWRRAAAGHDFRQTAFAYRAAQRLGEASDAEWRPRLETALAEADTYLFRGGHYPAAATCARGHAAARPRPGERGRRGATTGLRPPRPGHAAPHRSPRAPGAVEGGVP